MAMPSEEVVIEKLSALPEYAEGFKKAFNKESQPLTYKNIGVAIAAFEKTLLTPSPFDSFLEGKLNALSKKQKRGLKTFMDVGCITCHNGQGVGGGMFQKLGLANEYQTKDLGRYELTKDENDKFFFKVPSLRNITKTAPYFHDGSLKYLKTVVKIMGKHQLDVNLSSKQISDIVAFLNSLTGSLPKF